MPMYFTLHGVITLVLYHDKAIGKSKTDVARELKYVLLLYIFFVFGCRAPTFICKFPPQCFIPLAILMLCWLSD